MHPKYQEVHETILAILNDLAFGNGLGFLTDDLHTRLLSEWYEKRKPTIERSLDALEAEAAGGTQTAKG